MKTAFLLATASLLLASCATFPSGTVSDAPIYYPHSSAAAPVGEKAPVTFSVHINNTFGPDAWVTQQHVATAMQKKLEQSGLFSSVTCVSPNEAGHNHLSVDVTLSGLSPEARFGVGFLGGLTFTALPVWTTLDMDISLTARSQGNALATYHATQANTEVIWAPMVLAFPFCNHASARTEALEAAIEQLLQSMRADKLSQKFSSQ